MSHFVLKTESSAGMTSVSNLFLDYYMPRANGEYVKVYLYLLRALHNVSLELSVAGLADALDHTESDILRALKYWEKQGILKLECNSSRELQGIYLLDIPEPDSDTGPLHSSPVQEPQESQIPARKSYSRNDLAKFSGQAECRQLLFVCEQYLKKTLSSSEIETLLYFYDQLHFSADLIEYLVEYCVCKGSRSIHYIETVAIAWAEAGISTVSQAKERTTTYTRNCFAIMKAFGINDRNPVEPELKYIEKWLRTYDFTLDLILEACSRTMDRLHKPNFEYADRILKSWKENHVHTMADVQALDQAHQKRSSQKKPAANTRSTGFTNFQQRDYDFEELEKQLLQSQ
ncbi:MAG: DnaD domain protein [Clostridiales bacterium]|nr:DnaD domain protein [Clostridiales bacterium]